VVNPGFSGLANGSCIYYAGVQPTTAVCSAASGISGADECLFVTIDVLDSTAFAKAEGPYGGFSITQSPSLGTEAFYATIPGPIHPTTLYVRFNNDAFFVVVVADPFSSEAQIEAQERTAALAVLMNLNLQ
jgi:hypothetical protein